jgi:hypothetical protein
MKAAVRPQTDWSQTREQTHLVQFYEDEAALVPLLGRYVGTALISGDAAIVVTTDQLRKRLAKHLHDQGFDLTVPRSQKRYFDLDAAATLRRIMPGGSPDEVLFERVVGQLVDRAAARGRRVVVFGMMVDLLCATGRIDAAIRLEELWNELARHQRFTLACAYRMNRFSTGRDAAQFVRICSQHSHVFSAASR